MELKIALCGAHRSGKSTLAKAFAEKHGIQYLDMGTSGVAKQLGLDVSKPLSAADRQRLQGVLLCHYAQLFRTSGSWIADRSVFDLLVYTLIESPSEGSWAENYANDVQLLAEHLTHLVYVPSSIPVVYEEGKASISPDCILKADLLIRGCISRFVEDRTNPRMDLRFFRLNSTMNTVEQRVRQLSTMLQLF